MVSNATSSSCFVVGRTSEPSSLERVGGRGVNPGLGHEDENEDVEASGRAGWSLKSKEHVMCPESRNLQVIAGNRLGMLVNGKK